jgi:multidrug efflux pump subunit AcrB
MAVFGAPPVDELRLAGGFKLMVEDRGGGGLALLQGQADNLAEEGNKQPGLVVLFNGFRANTPQLYVDIDRTKSKTLGVPKRGLRFSPGLPGRLLRRIRPRQA